MKYITRRLHFSTFPSKQSVLLLSIRNIRHYPMLCSNLSLLWFISWNWNSFGNSIILQSLFVPFDVYERKIQLIVISLTKYNKVRKNKGDSNVSPTYPTQHNVEHNYSKKKNKKEKSKMSNFSMRTTTIITLINKQNSELNRIWEEAKKKKIHDGSRTCVLRFDFIYEKIPLRKSNMNVNVV